METQEVLERAAVPSGPPERAHPPLPFPGVFAFVGSGSLLVLELVAGRILAPRIGVSIYTWTSIIGVVLAGISLGNWLGGVLADRKPGRATLSGLYLSAAGTSALILLFARNLSAVEAPAAWPAALQVVWLTSLLFFVPSTILGMVTPMIVKLSLSSLAGAGRTVGRIQAMATLGSIVGTFATGFVLISAFGTRRIVAGVAITLAVLAAFSAPVSFRRRRVDAGLLIIFVIALTAVSPSTCTRESNYYCITVSTPVGASASVRALQLDHLVHGFVDLKDPTRLLYPYEQLYAGMLEAIHPPGAHIDTFFIGGGTYTFPRFVEQKYLGRVVVAEIDPAVTETVRTYFGLPKTSRIEVVDTDARRALDAMPATERFDVVFGDAFNDLSPPYHLTTIQFDRLVAAHLNPGGTYMLNIVDGVHHDFLRAIVATLRQVFPQVHVLAPPGAWPLQGLERPFVVVAGTDLLPRSAKIVPEEALARALAARPSTLLSDDHVPVDQLLAPVFRQRLER